MVDDTKKTSERCPWFFLVRKSLKDFREIVLKWENRSRKLIPFLRLSNIQYSREILDAQQPKLKH